MARAAPTLVAVLLAANAAGCAALAKKPPTPASDIPPGALDYPAPPNEKYYAIVFGSQKVPYIRPDLTHTWAVAVSGPGRDRLGLGLPGCGVVAGGQLLDELVLSELLAVPVVGGVDESDLRLPAVFEEGGEPGVLGLAEPGCLHGKPLRDGTSGGPVRDSPHRPPPRQRRGSAFSALG
jgi:hypothetical protein